MDDQTERVARAICRSHHEKIRPESSEESLDKAADLFWHLHLKEAQNAIEAMQGWRPIEEAEADTDYLVTDGEDTWVARKYASSKNYWSAHTMPSHGCGCCGGDDPIPTHFMPLPNPPKKG